MSDRNVNSVANALAPLLPKNNGNPGRLDDETMGLLQTSWRELDDLGFEVSVGADELVVRHGASGFKTVIQLSRPDDLGELRRLFLALRRTFGRLRDRWLPWLFLPGPSVTAPYEHLRRIIGTCQKLRQDIRGAR
ncbi:MAG TPA: hypothetical protein VK997_13050 [Deferrisomatales bacterium]|nr:hypothetical protein [Deferrisomatales bacterium]